MNSLPILTKPWYFLSVFSGERGFDIFFKVTNRSTEWDARNKPEFAAINSTSINSVRRYCFRFEIFK